MSPRRPLTTATELPQGEPPARGTFLLVVGDGHFSTHLLPPGREAVMGREEGCEIQLGGDAISRRHAVIRAGAPATVEDLGSKNGLRVRGQRLAAGERAALSPGESFQVGGYTVVVLAAAGGESAGEGPRASLVVADPRPEGVPSVVGRIARSPVNVLVCGETGVGKEVLARTLHAQSGRGGPFLGLNCAALGETLLESELFGYERGAFTGAVQAKPGLFETAAGGTVFLDEVGDMPLSTQAKLLRVLETRQALRLGSVRPVELDVRFLAATHRDLREAVREQKFRQDLYYRLNGITLVVPPLRERPEALPALAVTLLREAAERHGGAAPALAPAALAVLRAHPWPGNVRELRSVLERALILSAGGEIGPEHLVVDPPPEAAPSAAGDQPGASDERARIIAALEACAGNQTRAARVLGMSRATLVTKLALHRIPRPRGR
jgi:DNA-binding NtrC family response regulator